MSRLLAGGHARPASGRPPPRLPPASSLGALDALGLALVLVVASGCALRHSTPRPGSGGGRAPPASSSHAAGGEGQPPNDGFVATRAQEPLPEQRLARRGGGGPGGEPTGAPARLRPAAEGDSGWTSGIVEVRREQVVTTLRDVRIGGHRGYERFVFEFVEAVPGYHLEYIDRPVRDCGAGEVVELAGDGWLEIRLYPANVHDRQGNTTLPTRHLEPRFDVILEAKRTCAFEAIVTWVVGVGSPNRYRVFELSSPPRLVVDIAAPE